jgi:hypothetical protein
VIRDQLLGELRNSITGLTLPSILSRLRIDAHSPAAAAVEAVLILSPDTQCVESRWKLSLKGRSARILSAIEAYSSSTGKKIFRAGPALAALTTDEHPTADELREVLDSSGDRFTLLPNEMIRRNS